MNQIGKTLWIGDWFDARDNSEQFDEIVCVAIDDYAQSACPRSATIFPLIDGPGNEDTLMKDAIIHVASLLNDKKFTLVHCVAGRSRSIVVCSAAMHIIKEADFDECLEHVARLRKCEGPHQPHPALIELARSVI